MSYGMILGRLVINRRGVPRNKGATGGCSGKDCKESIPTGMVHIALLRTVKSKVKNKVFWTTRRFHLKCFQDWLEWSYEGFNAREAERLTLRQKSGRKRLLLQSDGTVTSEQLVTRNRMMKRRSYLLNRIGKEVLRPQSEQEILEEAAALKEKINAILPYIPFETGKRKALVKSRVDRNKEKVVFQPYRDLSGKLITE